MIDASYPPRFIAVQRVIRPQRVTDGKQRRGRPPAWQSVSLARVVRQRSVAVRSSILLLCLLVFLVASIALAQDPVRKTVLMIRVRDSLIPVRCCNAIGSCHALHSDQRFQVEFYLENLDAVYHPEEWQEQLDSTRPTVSPPETRPDLLVGPDQSGSCQEPKTIFPSVPVVFCGSTPVQSDQIEMPLRITGSWFHLEPAKTVEAALGLLPEIRHIVVVVGRIPIMTDV